MQQQEALQAVSVLCSTPQLVTQGLPVLLPVAVVAVSPVVARTTDVIEQLLLVKELRQGTLGEGRGGGDREAGEGERQAESE